MLSSLSAQSIPSVRSIEAELAADPKRAYGNDYPYLYQMPSLTSAPEGYRPFYISHYARHGSRYYWSDQLYCQLDTLLTFGHDRHLLTEAGEQFYQNFEAALPELKAGWGELTDLGRQQHQQTARTMYERFPEVFAEGGRVYAISSLAGRCVMSMAAFCLELKECNPTLQIREQSSRATLHAVVPGDRQNPQWRPFRRMTPRYEKSPIRPAIDTTLVSRILNRMFVSSEGITRSPGQIVDDLKNLYTSLPSIGYEGMMCGIYTDEDVLSQWEMSNLGSYSWVFGPQLESLPILEDILQQATDVIEGRSQDVATFRFGHDGCLGPLTVLMGVNGADLDPEDPMQVKYCYQNYETCKASNLQFIFYRSSSDPQSDILVKCLLNGAEATLPVPTSAFPYYRWDDFKIYYAAKSDQQTPIYSSDGL